MKFKSRLSLLGVGAIGFVGPQIDPIRVNDLDGDVRATFANGSVENFYARNKPATFTSFGTPNVVNSNRQGLQIVANKFSGTYSYVKPTVDSAGKPVSSTYNFDRLFGEGGFVVHYDSNQSRAFQTAHNIKPTDAAGIVTEITSADGLFNQNGKLDKLTFTHPFAMTDSRPGKNSEGSTQTSSRFTGSSGVFYFREPVKGGRGKMQSADVPGPVHYHQVQTVIDPKTGMPVTSEYDMTGDHLLERMNRAKLQSNQPSSNSADSSDGTGEIVLIGHVVCKMTGQQEGTFEGPWVVAPTDENGDLTGDFSTPTEDPTLGMGKLP